MNIANSILRDHELALDAVQESFLTVFQKLETLRDQNALFIRRISGQRPAKSLPGPFPQLPRSASSLERTEKDAWLRTMSWSPMTQSAAKSKKARISAIIPKFGDARPWTRPFGSWYKKESSRRMLSPDILPTRIKRSRKCLLLVLKIFRFVPIGGGIETLSSASKKRKILSMGMRADIAPWLNVWMIKKSLKREGLTQDGQTKMSSMMGADPNFQWFFRG